MSKRENQRCPGLADDLFQRILADLGRPEWGSLLHLVPRYGDPTLFDVKGPLAGPDEIKSGLMLLFRGLVCDPDGRPLAHALCLGDRGGVPRLVDVAWVADGLGSEEMRLRAR